MQLVEMFTVAYEGEDADKERPHWDALERTGFYGKAGAGCVFLARLTGRFLFAHRSHQVEQPGTWGCFGGAIDEGEHPAETVRREIAEEAGYTAAVRLVPLLVFRKATFRYSNFLAVVDREFSPKLNRESVGFRWCAWGQWPQPLHFGMVSLLNDPASAAKMQKLAGHGDEPSNEVETA